MRRDISQNIHVPTSTAPTDQTPKDWGSNPDGERTTGESLAETTTPKMYTSSYTRSMGMTTIKVPKELRDRINRAAKDRGVSAARVIEELLDARDHARRMAAFGRAIQGADEEYWAESAEWESASVENEFVSDA